MSGIRRNILTAAGVGLSAALLLSGCSGSTTAKPPTQTAVPFVSQQATQAPAASSGPATKHALITIKDTGVDPASVSVKPGGRVVWENAGSQSHTIAVKGGVTSPPIKAGGSASHVFTQEGTYSYFDPQNPAIQGVIIVKN